MAKLFDNFLTITSAATFVVIVIVLVMFPIEIFSSPTGPSIADSIANENRIKRILRSIAFLYGTMFAPGTIVSIVYAIYIRKRYLGRPRSYLLEVITLLVAVQTVLVYISLQNL